MLCKFTYPLAYLTLGIRWESKKLIVAVISGSFLPQDIDRSMASGANAYYKKTPLKDEQEAMVHDITLLLDKWDGLPQA